MPLSFDSRRWTVASLVLLMVVGGCTALRGKERMPANVPAEREDPRLPAEESQIDPQQGSEFAHLKLPESVSDMEFRARGGMDPAVWFSFRASSGDVQRFLAESDLPPLRSRYQAIQTSAAATMKWPLDALGDFDGVRHDVGHVQRQVVVDRGDPDYPRVYVFAFHF